MRRLKVAILADYLEEGWPSMDLVADMLLDRLQREHPASIEPTLIRPSLRRRASRLHGLQHDTRAFGVDRIANRLWDYPRVARGLGGRFDLFHVVDHSYAQLVHGLPAGRTLVTCHDLDTFRSVLEPDIEPRSAWFRAMSRHILEGLRKAGHVACDTGATLDAVIRKAGVNAERASVVHNGPHPSCTPLPDASAEREATRLLGRPSQTIDLLHVGSTIPRKRIDVLLRIMADVRQRKPSLRLIRVGGPFTAEQRALARDLGILDAVLVLPVLDRSTLAAVYRRSALLLMPSEREGFGLPVLEALACATPVVASDIPPLREVAAAAATYCAVGDIPAWAGAVERLIDERRVAPAQWTLRCEAAQRRAAAFSWSHYAAHVVSIYARLAQGIAC